MGHSMHDLGRPRIGLQSDPAAGYARAPAAGARQPVQALGPAGRSRILPCWVALGMASFSVATAVSMVVSTHLHVQR